MRTEPAAEFLRAYLSKLEKPEVLRIRGARREGHSWLNAGALFSTSREPPEAMGELSDTGKLSQEAVRWKGFWWAPQCHEKRLPAYELMQARTPLYGEDGRGCWLVCEACRRRQSSSVRQA